MVSFIGKSIEFIYCHCGCGFTTSKYKIEKGCYPRRDRPKKYIKGHGMKGKQFSEKFREKNRLGQLGKKLSKETKKKLSEAFKGSKNPMYGKQHSIETKIKIGRANTAKGFVSYSALHVRVRKIFPKPELCQICLLVPPVDLACKTNIYEEDPINWAWFCRSCHKKHDFIMNGRRKS